MRLFYVLLTLSCFELSAQTIPQHPNRTDAQGRRQGIWTILSDKYGKEVQDTDQAQFYGIIRYQNDLALGKVRLYYRSGVLKVEGDSLIKNSKEYLRHGKFVEYYESGKVEQIGWYKQGKLTKLEEYNLDGTKKDKLPPFDQGIAYYKDKEYDKAWPILEQYKNIILSVSEDKPRNAYIFLDILSICYVLTNKFEKAHELTSALEKLEGKLDTVWVYLNNRGKVFFQAGKYIWTQKVFEKARIRANKEFGSRHPAYATSCNNLASLYESRGEYNKAESLYLEAKAIRSKVLGSDHPAYATSCNNLGVLYESQGKYNKAESLYLEAKAIRSKVLGTKHPVYATSCNNLASLYESQGKYNKAESLYLKAKAIQLKVLGSEHPAYATSCDNLAILYRVQRRYKEAKSLYLEAKAIRLKVLGNDHPAYAASCNNLGVLYDLKGKYRKAELLYLEAKAIRLKILGSDHPTYATSCNNLGVLYESQGKYNKAELLYLKAKAIRSKVLGTKHPDYAISCNNLAGLYESRGEYNKAESLYLEAKAIRLKVLGSDHPAYATSCDNLAILYRVQGRYKEAESLYLKAKAIRSKVLGTKHPAYATSCNNLAILYRVQGRYKEAELLYLEAKAIRLKVLGSKHPVYATSCDNLGVLYDLQGKYRKTELLYLEAKAIRSKVLGTKHPAYATSCNNLASLYDSQGKYNKAELLYLEAKTIRSKVLGTKHPDYAVSCNNLAGLYESRGEYNKAESLYLEAKAIRLKILGSDHPAYATSCNNLAILYRVQGRYKEAELLYLEAKAIRSKVLGIEHPVYANSCNNLAVLYEILGKYLEAELLYLEAQNILTKSLGVSHPIYASICNNLAVLYKLRGRYNKAKSLYSKAKKIRAKVLKTNHPDYAISCNNLAGLYESLGKYKRAESLYLEAKNIRKKVLGAIHLDYTSSCCNLAGLYELQGRYWEAFKLWQEVFTNLQNQLKNNLAYTSEKNRQQFLQANMNNQFVDYHSFAQDYIDSLTIPQSQQILTQWYNNQLLTKSLLFQSTQKTKERIYSSGDTALIQQFEAFIAQRVYRNKVLEWTIDQRKQNGVSLDSLNAQINALEQALARKSVEFAQELEEYEWHDWQEIQQQLNSGEVAIEIIRYNRWRKKWGDAVHYAALIVTPQSRFPYPVFLKNGDFLEGKGFQYYQKRNIAKKTRGVDVQSYAHFWQPIQQQIKELYPEAKRVFVSLDGVYHQLNLETLWNPTTQKYLGEELDIRLVSNTKDLLKRKARKKNKSGGNQGVRLFGFPTYDQYPTAPVSEGKTNISALENPFGDRFLDIFKEGKVPKLAGTRQEVRKILKLLRNQKIEARGYIANEATEANIKALRSPRVLHLATHGYLLVDTTLRKAQELHRFQLAGTELKQYVENPLLRCGLLWAGAEATIKNEKFPKGVQTSKSRFIGENGLLTAQEVVNLYLDNTDLVVLSACETGKGKIQNGEGVYGLQRAFLSAGAKNVLMSLWKVDDVATQWFMQYFYESWAKDQDVRKAYRFAQRKLRVDYPSPYYWGAFVLVSR